MFLPLTAALLHATAYTLYALQVLANDSVPNPATWSIWAVLAVVNAVTFSKGAKSFLKAAQFITGSVTATVVWLITLHVGKFAPIGTLEYWVIGVCAASPLVWWLLGKATYANILIGIILIVSFIPTVRRILDGTATEQPLPWFIWTLAFACTSINIYVHRHDEHEISWKYMMFLPVSMVFAHLLVGILA